MSSDTKKERHPFASLDANSQWVDRLLDLFWVVDEQMKQEDSDKIPGAIQDAWERAESARTRL